MTRLFELSRMKATVAFMVCAPLVASLSCEGAMNRRASDRVPATSAAPAAPTDLINEARSSGGDAAKARYVYFQTPTSEIARRIIYEAEIYVVVKSMSQTEAQLGKLLKQFDGYVSESNVDRRQGERLTGRWKVRVPTTQFDAFLEEVSKLGIAESRRQTAQDVTAEYVDLEAQISNKKKLEERIVALLEDSSGNIKDVIEVERELGRVRGEIEQMEGRLRYLSNRTDLTAVTIVAREEENYVPPAAPTFANRITQAWRASLDNLRAFGEESVVAIVAAFPWVAVLSVVLVPSVWYARKRVRRYNRATLEPPGGAASTV